MSNPTLAPERLRHMADDLHDLVAWVSDEAKSLQPGDGETAAKLASELPEVVNRTLALVAMLQSQAEAGGAAQPDGVETWQAAGNATNRAGLLASELLEEGGDPIVAEAFEALDSRLWSLFELAHPEDAAVGPDIDNVLV